MPTSTSSGPESPSADAFVTLAEDDYSREFWLANARWVATLSDGRRAHQDDGRPGHPDSAWLRLGRFLAASGLHLVGLRVGFRNGPAFVLPGDADGYFFRTAAGAFANGRGRTYRLYLAGHLQGGLVRVRTYQVPEMRLLEEEDRDPADPGSVGPSLLTKL